MTVRFTVKCPKLAQYPAKGISPDYLKDRVAEEKAKGMKGKDAVIKVSNEISAQTTINEKYNARGLELGDILIEKLNEVDITWCNDGCLVVSCDNTLEEIEQLLLDEGLEIQEDKSDIKHKVKLLDNSNPNSENEEDIDEVFEPQSIGELKKLKSKQIVNKYKTKKKQ